MNNKKIKIEINYDNDKYYYETKVALCHCLLAEILALHLLAMSIRDKLEEYFSKEEINRYYQDMLIDRYDKVSTKLYLIREINKRQEEEVAER